MRRKILIVIACASLITVLAPVLYYYFYVPNVLGKQYVSVSFRPAGFSHAVGSGNVEVVYNGRIVKINGVGIEINVTNSYFAPVHIKYNGFDVVWLIYNQTVSDPSDVVNNRNFLVWGAFYHLVLTAYHGYRGVDRFTEDSFEYYASQRELSNFTKTIKTGSYLSNYPLFMWPGTQPTWTWEYWFNVTSYVPTGTYYMYCVIFGIASDPHNFTITSVPW